MLKLSGLENLKLMVDMEGENNPTLKLTGGISRKTLTGIGTFRKSLTYQFHACVHVASDLFIYPARVGRSS